MAIVASDIVMRLSGGSGNTDPDSSLGGAISSTAVVDNSINDLWDNVSGQETTDGDVEYRCVYIRNSHATLTAFTALLWIDTNTTSTSTTVEIGLGTSAIDGIEQTVANESSAPSGVTFSAAGVGTELSIGDLDADQHKAIWIRRTVTALGSATDDDTYILSVSCDTNQ